MIREIIIDGEVLNADHWFEAGLPAYLHECLDGTPWLYQESRQYFGEAPRRDTGRAIESMFRSKESEDALESLKIALFDRMKRVKDEIERELRSCDIVWPAAITHNFLQNLFLSIDSALQTSPTLYLTKKEIEKNLDAAKRAVHVIKNSPLNCSHSSDNGLMLVVRLIMEKYEEVRLVDTNRAFSALLTLLRELELTGKSCSFGELLDFWVISLASEQVHGVSRPHRGDAKKRHFCFTLADELGGLTEKCVYREVAILARVIFPDTTEDYVRKAYERAKKT